MKISAHPDNYTGVYTELLYTIEEADPATVTEITAVEPGTPETPIGMKRFSGSASFTVNVANYYRKYLNPKPVFTPEILLINPTGRHTTASVIANGITSKKSIVTAGAENAGECCFMSHSPERLSISPEESDELSFFAPGHTLTAIITLKGKAGIKTIRTNTLTCGEGIYTYMLNMKNLSEKAGGLNGYSDMSVEFTEGGKTVMRKKYDITPHEPSAIRLCWLNPFGAIDYHTFSPVRSETVGAVKNRVYGESGYETAESQAETYRTVTSRCETADTMRWLAEIISSPRVWIVNTDKLNTAGEMMSGGECFTAVDMTTNSAVIYGDSPAVLSLTLREKKKKTFQNG